MMAAKSCEIVSNGLLTREYNLLDGECWQRLGGIWNPRKETFRQSLSSCLFCWLLLPSVFVFRVERSQQKNPTITKRRSFVHSIYIKFTKLSLKKDESFVFQLSFHLFKIKQDFVELVSTDTCFHFVLILHLVQHGGSLFELS